MKDKKGKKMKYRAIANGVHSKRELIPLNNNFLDIIKKRPDRDFYTSLFKYTEEHFKEFQETKTLSGITGVQTDKLFFDFDDASNIERTKVDTLEICDRLIEMGVPEDKIGTYFSGNKGFHVEVHLTEDISQPEFKNIVFHVADGLDTFDTRINDAQRILRVALTRHQKTELYKFPFTVAQLREYNIEKIKTLAEDIGNVDEKLIPSWTPVDLPDAIAEFKDKPYKPAALDIAVNMEDLSFDPKELDLRNIPKGMDRERYALQEGFFQGSVSAGAGGGERNDAFMILASTYRKMGHNKLMALSMLDATSQIQGMRCGEAPWSKAKIEREIVNAVYKRDWNGGIYRPDHPLLIKTRQRFGLTEKASNGDVFISNEDMFSAFVDYAVNIEANTILTGLPIDDDIRITIGMAVALLGAPSSGKTSTALNILKNTSLRGIESLFFSLDMHKALVSQKQVQMNEGIDSKILYKRIKDPENQRKYLEGIKQNFGNVHYCNRAGMTVDDIRMEIEKKQREMSNLKLIMIDYLECIRGDYQDVNVSMTQIADGIKNIAVDLDLCVILLVQPPKTSGGASQPLTSMYQIKGSSMIAQAMRAVIGIYREGFTPDTVDDDKFITFVGLKNSMGGLFKRDCSWDGPSGKVDLLTHSEEKQLDLLRQRIERDKKNGF